MKPNLDNKSMTGQDILALDHDISRMVERLDQQHSIERKVKFFLDIRGYLKLNAISGNYVEFGSFRSWTQYAAYRVLDETGLIQKYVGIDAFQGEPTPTIEEAAHMPIMAAGDFKCDYCEVSDFVERAFAGKGALIRGDFREAGVKAEVKLYSPISLSLVDCNLRSSLEAALVQTMESAIPGCALFVDDYFTNFGRGQAVIPNLCYNLASQYGWVLVEHSFYPPFAKSFILARR